MYPVKTVSTWRTRLAKAAGAVSSKSSSRVKVQARKTALKAQAAALKRKQELELEELKLKQRQRKLKLKTKLEMAEAKEEVYSMNERASLQGSKAASQVKDGAIPFPAKEQEIDAGVLEHLHEAQRKHQLLDINSLPRVEVIKFGRDPLMYHEFTNCFDNMVLRSSLDSGGKLMRLYHLCKGEAKALIQTCMMMELQEGFVKARTLLAECYGSGYKIGEACLKRVTEGGNLQANDHQGLQKFADDLQTCVETLRALNMIQEVGSQSDLVRVVK